MDCEITISGRILAQGGRKPLLQADILAALGVKSCADVSEDALAGFCRALSERLACEVYVWMDREEYGNENVFNGGSDYSVVNEVCFLSVCENGKEKVRERTDRWNSKIEDVL